MGKPTTEGETVVTEMWREDVVAGGRTMGEETP